MKGNSNINRGLRFSNISNRDNSNKENLKFSSQNNSPRREFNSRKDKSKGLRFSNHKDKSKDLRFSSQDNNLRRKFSNHNTLSLKENLKEGR